MHFIAYLLLDQFRQSICLEHPEHCENGERDRPRPCYYVEPIESRTRATEGTHL